MSSEVNTQPVVRYFDSQVLNEESRLTEAEALERQTYVAAYYLEERVERLEVVIDGRVSNVIYPEHHGADERLIDAHKQRYGHCPFETRSQEFRQKGERIIEIAYYDDDAKLVNIVEEHMDHKGDVLFELRRDRDGKPISKSVWVYNEAGDLIAIRHYRPVDAFWFEEGLE